MNRIAGTRWGAVLLGVLLGVVAQAETTAGRTVGEASVTSTGAARYVIPLALPPGTNGLAPALAITYDSRSGHGLLGVGFRLEGFSVVQRCAATLAQDGAPAAVALVPGDQYCLDGQRLRLAAGVHGRAGAEYRTEVESFARITAIGAAGSGPASFRVERRDGLVYEYGTTADARIESVGSSTPRAWAVSRVLDRAGNYVEFRYVEDGSGAYRPASIDYAGNAQAGTLPYYSVRFAYQARPAMDRPSAYLAGGLVREAQRLARIEIVHVGTQDVVRRYELAYDDASGTGRGRLASLRECARSSCLPASRFEWSTATPGWSAPASVALNAAGLATAIPGDMDGDGFEDLAYYDGNSRNWWLLRGSAGGLAAAVNTYSGNDSDPARAVSADFDGDGRRELLFRQGDYWRWLRRSGSGFTSSSTGIPASASSAATAADIDGDGRDDLVLRSASGDSLRWRRSLTTSTTPWFADEQVLWSAPAGSVLAAAPFVESAQQFRSAVRRADFNGDGRADLLVRVVPSTCTVSAACAAADRWELLASNGSALLSQAAITAPVALLLADFNADGLTDVAHAGADLQWQLLLGAGSRDSTTAAMAGPIAGGLQLPASAAAVLATDWNADGRTDLVLVDASGLVLACGSDGATLTGCQSLAGAMSGPVATPVVLDANGDGLQDVAFGAGSETHLLLHDATAPDLMVVAADGLGAESRFSYAPLTRSDVHAPGSGAVFPVRDQLRPALVVSSAVRAVEGGLLSETYTYEGARWHAQGRGFLGFARRSVLEAASQLRQVDEYLQDPAAYDRIGALSRSTLQLLSGRPVTVSTYYWSRLAFGKGYLARSFPYVSSATTDRYELDGVPFLRVTESNAVDSFGTVVRRQVSTQELAKGASPWARHIELVTLGGVVNDTQSWCLGRPATTQLSRQHTLATGAQLVRRYAHGWDYVRCRATQEVVEPSSATLKATTDFAYDAYGNLATVSVTPVGQAVRVTSLGWTADGRFPQSRTDAESQVERTTWDPVLALPVTVQDANGLVTRFAYDEFGRGTRSVAPDGTGATVARELCSDGCPWPDTRYTVRTTRRGSSGLALGFAETGYDRHDRVVYVRSDQPGGTETWRARRYDTGNRLAQESLPAACCGVPEHWVSFGYDPLGRREREYRPTGGSMARRAWRHDGLTLTETDALGRSTVRKFNAVGAVAQVIDAAGSDTDYEYDAFGNLVRVRDFNGAETLLSYDVLGRRTGLLDRASGLWLYEYHPLGEVKRQVNGRGQVVSYTWDRLARPLTRTEPEGLTTWTWGSSVAAHNVGALESVRGPNVGERYSYDDHGRLSSVTRNVQAQALVQAYSHDPESGLVGESTYPSVGGAAPLTVRHRYDRGRLVELADAETGASYWRLDSVDAFDHPTRETLGNGVQVVSTYDPASGLLTERASGPGGDGSQQHLSFEWDAAGNLLRRQERITGVEETFSYDAVNRLDEVRRDGRLALDLAYDAVGNLTYKSDVGEYRYDAERGTVVAAGANAYSYDANGAVASAGGATIFWQSYDLPMRILHPAGNYSMFEYGPDRSRARQLALAGGGATDTLYGPGGLYEHVTTDGEVSHRNYLVAAGRRIAVQTRKTGAAPSTVYLLEDQLGSVDGFSSASGELLSRNSYQPFGAHRSGDWQASSPTSAEWQQIQATTPRGYTGHEHLNNLGVIHMNGRIYDPVLGRFLSPDPVVQAPHDTQGFNRYAYVRNNPLRYVDPSGFCVEPVASYRTEDGSARCLEEVFSYGKREQSEAPWFLSFDFWMQAALLNALPGAFAGDPLSWGGGGGAVPPEEVVTTASRLPLETSVAAAVPRALPLPWEAAIGRSLGMFATSAGIAGLLAMPAATSATSELLDDAGEPRVVYHFTNETGRRGISASRFLMPGASGRVYFTNRPYPTAGQAQSALALPNTPAGFFAVPRQNVPGELTWTPIAPNFGQPGGGMEASFPGVVPLDGAQWYPVEP